MPPLRETTPVGPGRNQSRAEAARPPDRDAVLRGQGIPDGARVSPKIRDLAGAGPSGAKRDGSRATAITFA